MNMVVLRQGRWVIPSGVHLSKQRAREPFIYILDFLQAFREDEIGLQSRILVSRRRKQDFV